MSEGNKNLDTPRKLAEQIVALVDCSKMDDERKGEAMELAYHMAFGSSAYNWLLTHRSQQC